MFCGARIHQVLPCPALDFLIHDHSINFTNLKGRKASKFTGFLQKKQKYHIDSYLKQKGPNRSVERLGPKSNRAIDENNYTPSSLVVWQAKQPTVLVPPPATTVVGSQRREAGYGLA